MGLCFSSDREKVEIDGTTMCCEKTEKIIYEEADLDIYKNKFWNVSLFQNDENKIDNPNFYYFSLKNFTHHLKTSSVFDIFNLEEISQVIKILQEIEQEQIDLVQVFEKLKDISNYLEHLKLLYELLDENNSEIIEKINDIQMYLKQKDIKKEINAVIESFRDLQRKYEKKYSILNITILPLYNEKTQQGYYYMTIYFDIYRNRSYFTTIKIVLKFNSEMIQQIIELKKEIILQIIQSLTGKIKDDDFLSIDEIDFYFKTKKVVPNFLKDKIKSKIHEKIVNKLPQLKEKFFSDFSSEIIIKNSTGGIIKKNKKTHNVIDSLNGIEIYDGTLTVTEPRIFKNFVFVNEICNGINFIRPNSMFFERKVECHFQDKKKKFPISKTRIKE